MDKHSALRDLQSGIRSKGLDQELRFQILSALRRYQHGERLRIRLDILRMLRELRGSECQRLKIHDPRANIRLFLALFSLAQDHDMLLCHEGSNLCRWLLCINVHFLRFQRVPLHPPFPEADHIRCRRNLRHAFIFLIRRDLYGVDAGNAVRHLRIQPAQEIFSVEDSAFLQIQVEILAAARFSHTERLGK